MRILKAKKHSGPEANSRAGDIEALRAEINVLRGELENYKHAFETTAADRDEIERSFLEVTDPLDAGYFRFDLKQFILNRGKDDIAEALSMEWDKLFDNGQYQELMKSIFDHCQPRLSFPVGDDYLRSKLVYLMATFYSRRHEFEKAKKFADEITYSASIDGADLLPYDIAQSSRSAFYRQSHAIRKNAPGALIVSLQKSASAYLSQSISHVLEVPILRSSIGEGAHSLVVSKWASQIAMGGAVTHEHFRAHPTNLECLANSDVKKVWVQIRDPRDATYSNMRMLDVSGKAKDPAHERYERNFVNLSKLWAEWIAEWVQASEDKMLPFDIEFLTFDEVTADLTNVFERLFQNQITTATANRLERFISDSQKGKIDRRNFRKGVGGDWRDVFSQDAVQKAWENIPGNVRTILELER